MADAPTAYPAGNDGDQTSPNEIPWQTVFFWMVCFALNAMAQPTGRLLGIPFQHQSVLRTSPIISICDAIGVVGSMLHATVLSSPKIRVRQAASCILQARVVDKENQPDPQAIPSLKAQSKARWVGFLLGAFPQFINLFASKSIQLHQAFGALYLTS
ncbi:hypothetical protein BJX76DRAFT_362936 [Aspergillus varians]